ncbi:MAG TPA: TonB family protein [Pyrinomonadaceae bacterium]
MKTRRPVNSDVMLLHPTNVIRLVLATTILFSIALLANGQDQEVHLKCPITRELLIQLDWPGVVKSVIPAYPAIAAARRISGPVRVDVDINPNGTVTAARVISGDKILSDAAKDAALRWTFRPTANGAQSIPLNFIFRPVDYVAPKEKPECGTSPYTVEILRVAIV